MIAAGEVVQRPASVVKELMENAVDAGATDVKVIVTDAGRTLIQVIDNGSGMNPDDAVLCFERHATSKLATPEDLHHILTFGFRGEALASIAAVADVTLRTRTPDQDAGVEVQMSASENKGTKEVSCPIGTNIAVRNLFFNIPARRKFLKSDNVELRHIVEEFQRVALTRPDIGFTLTHNGRDIHVVKPAKSFKFRIQDLLGAAVVGEVVDIEADTTIASLRGYAGRPESAKKTLGNQFFFVNGRYFRSPYLHKAVMKAYEEFVPEGLTPSYFIFLEVDPHTVDVNIHPTKSEIKFEEDNLVFRTLYACVRETLGRNSFGASIDFDNDASAQLPVFGKSFDEYKPAVSPKVELDPDYNPFEPLFEGDNVKAPSGWDASKYVDRHEDYGKLFEDKTVPVSQTIILDGRYIVAPVKEGLMVVNIRRARERILYDRTLAALNRNGHVTQANMFPVKVQVGVSERMLLEEKAGLLSSLGFDISPLGNDTVVVNGVPEGFSGEAGKVQTMVQNLILILSDDSASLPGVMESAMAEKIALLGASSSNPMASPMEARLLLDTLLSGGNPELTSNGKRIMAILNLSQVEKLF